MFQLLTKSLSQQKKTTPKTVILILTNGDTLRQILLSAFDLGMSNGGYVFLSVELFKHVNSFGNFQWYVPGDTRNEVIYGEHALGFGPVILNAVNSID